MFFLCQMDHKVILEPTHFHSGMEDRITRTVLTDLEGTLVDTHYIVCIMDFDHITDGIIHPGIGSAEFIVSFLAVIWTPFKGESLNVIVTSINPHGLLASFGPLTLFVATQLMGSEIEYNADSAPPQFTHNDGSVIVPGSNVRVKVIGKRANADGMHAVASMEDAYFGLLEGEDD